MHIRITIACGLVLFPILLIGTAHAQLAEEDIMGYWLFEDGGGEIAQDSSQNGYDAELTGAVDWDEGKYGDGVVLEGGQVVVPGTEETFQLTSYSLMAWVKPEATGGFQGIIHKEEGGVSGRTFLMYLGTDGSPKCSISQGGTNADFGTNTPVTDGKWHHIAVTFDEETRVAQVYLDGIPAAMKEYPEDAPQHNAIVKFNKTNYRGGIDEVLITNRAIEEAAILKIMEGLGDLRAIFSVRPAHKLALSWGALRLQGLGQ